MKLNQFQQNLKSMLAPAFVMGMSLVFVACNEHELPTEWPAESSSVLASSSSQSVMIDGANNEYAVVKAGGLEWSQSNLKYIPDTNGISCAKSENVKCISALYSYERAQTVCPIGWRLPSDEDWRNLVIDAGSKTKANCAQTSVSDSIKSTESYKIFPSDALIGTCAGYAGRNLKATTVWKIGQGFDLMGWTGLPDGYVDRLGDVLQAGEYAYFWSSNALENPAAYTGSEAATGSASSWYLTKDSWMVHADNFKDVRFSVRCVRPIPQTN